MQAWTLLLALAAFAASASASSDKIVCYFGSWSVYRHNDGKFDISYIDPTLCTHLIYTFVGISTEGDVRVLDGWQDLPDNYGKDGFGRFNKLREINPKVKTLVAIGGWNEGSVKYSQVVSNPATRSRFVDNVVKFVKRYGFDGFDLDWEYPNQRGGKESDKENFVSLVRELRAKFDEHGLVLTAAVGAAEVSASKSYIISELSKHFHFINLMTYDLHGSWESQTGLNAPLYPASRESGNQAKLNVDSSVKYWLAEGADPKKLVLGVPFYGRSFTLANPSNNSVGAPTTGPGTAGQFTREGGMLGYNEICLNVQNGWTVKYDEEQRVPYAYKGNQWVGYDDVKSLTEKANYIKKLGLGGAMLWSIETDDFRGRCGEQYPLLKTLNHVLRGGPAVSNKPPVTNAPVTKPPVNQPTNKPVNPPVNEPTVPVNPPADHSICKHEGYVRDPKDCGVFYVCVLANGVYTANRFTCAAGLAFDLTIKACNYQDKVQC